MWFKKPKNMLQEHRDEEIQRFIIPPDYHLLMASIVYLKTRFTWDEELIKNEKMTEEVQEITNSFFENLEFYRSAATDRTDFVSYSIFPAPEPKTSIQNVSWIKRDGEIIDRERQTALTNFFRLCDSLVPGEEKKYEKDRHRFLRLELLNFLTSDHLNKSIEVIAKTKGIPDTEVWSKIAMLSLFFCKEVETKNIT